MSNKYVNEIRKVQGLKSSEKFTLWVIADHINETKGDIAWPSYETIAEDTSMSRRSVARAVKELAKIGLITIDHQRHFNKYKINLDVASQMSECHCVQSECHCVHDRVPNEYGQSATVSPNPLLPINKTNTYPLAAKNTIENCEEVGDIVFLDSQPF